MNNESFLKATEGYLLKDEGDGNKSLTMKFENTLATLSENWDAYIFENDDCMAVFEKNTFGIQQFEWLGDDNIEIELPEVPKMKMILDATRNLI